MVDLEQDRIVAVEALARFDTEPYRPPNEWFDEAAQVDLRTDLEQAALAGALDILPCLSLETRLSCNVSSRAILDSGLRDLLARQDLRRIMLEITEHDIVENYQELIAVLQPLRDQGLWLAVDDFGAGYASFRHILLLDPDVIKIDMGLVRGIDQHPTARSIVKALVAFADENDLRLVAEGVETECELKVLKSLGVTRIQGYLLHRPMREDALLGVLRSLAAFDASPDRALQLRETRLRPAECLHEPVTKHVHTR